MAIVSDTGIWTIGDNWPWPQMFFTSYYNLAIAVKANDKLALYELVNQNNTWIATEKIGLGKMSNIISVHIADFQKYYMITVNELIDENPDHGIYSRNPITGVVTEVDTNIIPAGITCCNYLGQLIIGGIFTNQSPWKELSKCSVIWSDIGSTEMNPEDYVTAGFATMPWDENGNGEVYKVLPLGNTVRVYGDRGIANLLPYDVGNTVGFGVSPVEYPGILSSDSIAGDEKVHGYVDANYDWWLITGEKAVNLGYRKFMKTLTNRILVRYDSSHNRFYISDGVLCYVYTKYGMYSTNQCVSSIGNYKGILCGFVKDNEDTKIRLETKSVDFGYQGHKTIEAVETGLTYDTVANEEISGALSVKYDYKGDFLQLPWTSLNPRGIFTQKATGREFKFHLQGDYEAKASFSLNSLTPKIKFPDKRNMRGRINVS